MKTCIIHRHPFSYIETTYSTALLVISGLISKGHEVYFVNFKDSIQATAPIKAQAFHHYPVGLTYNRDKTLDRVVKSLLFHPLYILKVLQLKDIDLVYYSDPFCALSGILVKKLKKAGIVIRLGDLFTAYFFSYKSFIARLLARILLPFEIRLLQAADRILVTSLAFKEFLMARGVPADKLRVVYDQVDVERFSPLVPGREIREQYKLRDMLVIMTHGILTQYKGFEDLITIAPAILKEFPNARFLIIGGGPTMKRLQRYVVKENVANFVTLTGWIPYKEIPKHIAATNVGVVLRRPGLANELVITQALLQYLSSGKPVVAPRLKAISEVIRDGVTGLLFEPGNSADLREKVHYLLENNARAVAMGKNGRRIVEERFDRNITAGMIVNECREIARVR